MAVVYRARDCELDRDVAIKVLADHLASDEEFRQRFLREARIAAKLSHPNVVSVYDGGESDGLPYIVMEFVLGVTLAEELARHDRLSPDEATGLAVQACAGLEHAHAAGLVHRDIKPQNLLLGADGVLKIADFGIARAVEGTQLTEVGTVLGTAAYLSPEQASGEQVSFATDIYSLGAVTYELIAGQPPFSFENLHELVLKKRSGRVVSLREFVPELPPQLDAIVLRCLSPEPSARPPSAAALAQELSAFAPDAVTVPFPATTPVRRAHSRRRVWPLAATVAAVAALVGGLVLATRDGNGSNPPSRKPPAIEPVAPGSTPAERARNLADWIRNHSG